MVASVLIFAEALVSAIVGRADGIRSVSMTSALSRHVDVESPSLAHMMASDTKLLSSQAVACYAFAEASAATVTSISNLMRSAAAPPDAVSSLMQSDIPEGDFGLVTDAMPSIDRNSVIDFAITEVPEGIDLDAHICTCDASNLILNVAGMTYSITSYKPSLVAGNAMTPAGDIPLQVMLDGVSALDITLENMPATVFTVFVRRRTYDEQNNLVHMSVDFQDKIPAWICVQGALQVFVGDVGYGCINRFDVKGGQQTTYVERSDEHTLKPTTQEVTLNSGESQQTFTLVHQPQNETDKLEWAVLSLLRQQGGTRIQVCSN